MKCYNCGFENEYGATFCKECGVNLEMEGKKDSKKHDDVLNDKFKVVKKRQSYPIPSENSIKAKLMYKHDERTGELRLAKTKCATIVVFSAFFIFSFVSYSGKTILLKQVFASINLLWLHILSFIDGLSIQNFIN